MKTVIGLYDRLGDAHHTVKALEDAGFPREEISLVTRNPEGKDELHRGSSKDKEDLSQGLAAGAGVGAVLGGLGGLLVGLGALAIPGIGPVLAAGPIATALAGAGIGAAAGGILGALIDLGIPEEHAEMYAEGVRRGGTLVIVRSQDQRMDEAVQIMNRFNPVDIGQRSQEWRQSNWQGFNQDAEPYTDQQMEQDRARQMENIPVTGSEQTTFPVIEEDVQVGKREVQEGGVRINSYVREEPVDKDINLRREHVDVERRPVDRPATDADFNAFEEGSIELTESREEPMVRKEARVVEEVHVNKDVDEVTETIHDSVRRQDVDVERFGADWNRYQPRFQQHYQTYYGSTNRGFEYYQPGYRYGYELANNPRYRDYDWDRLEMDARRDWEQKHGDTLWDDIKDAVRHGWQSVTGR